MDNYSYLIIDESTKKSAIIDPSEANPIISYCNKLDIVPDFILNTHHHFDHTDGNLELKKYYGLQIVGAEDRIPGIDIYVEDGQSWNLGYSQAEVIDVSAHTQGHILWYFPNEKALFTGDTLFNLCIGGLFEGTPLEMYKALQKIKELPDDVKFYPGHEYTKHCMQDAWNYNASKELEEYINLANLKLENNLPVHPVSLGIEKRVNPYLMAKSFEDFTKIVW